MGIREGPGAWREGGREKMREGRRERLEGLGTEEGRETPPAATNLQGRKGKGSAKERERELREGKGRERAPIFDKSKIAELSKKQRESARE